MIAIYEGEQYLGEISHIYPVKKGGPRYDPSIDPSYINTYPNLLLLCPRCHTKIDTDERTYTAVMLKAMKAKIDAGAETIIESALLDKIANQAQEKFEELLDRLADEIEEMLSPRFDELRDLIVETRGPITKPDEAYFNFSEQSDEVKMLRRKGHQKALVDLLINYKTKHWDGFNDESKYKLSLALGLAYFDLTDYRNAGACLIALSDFSFKPRDALGYVAIGHLVSQHIPEARAFAKAALEQDPANVNAYVALIQCRDRADDAAEAIEIPEAIKDEFAILITRAKVLEQQGRFNEACTVYASVAVGAIKDSLALNDYRAFYGIALMESIKNAEIMLKQSPDQSPGFVTVRKAHELFTSAIEYFKDTQLHASRYYLYINRGIANKYLREADASEDDFKKAFELTKGYIPFRYLLINSPSSKWQRLLQESTRYGFPPEEAAELKMIEAEHLLSESRIAEGIALLEEVRPIANRDPGKFEYYYLNLADGYNAAGDIEKANGVTSFAKKTAGLEFIYLMLATKSAGLRKELGDYASLRDQLIVQTEQRDIAWLRAAVFDLLCSFGDFRNAHGLLAPICDKAHFTDYSRKYVQCLFKAGLYREAALWIENYMAIGQGDGYMIDILTTIYDFCAWRWKAIEVLKKYLTKHIEVQMQAKLALFYFYENEIALCAEELNKIPDISGFTKEAQFLICSVNIQTGNRERGLERAYQLMVANMADGATQIKYVSLISGYCMHLPEYAAPERVTLDSYVRLVNENKEAGYVIVTDPALADEISPSDPRAKILLGLKIDDVALLDGEGFSVREITSKFAFRFNRIVRDMASEAQQQAGITRFEGQSPEDSATEVIRQISEASLGEEQHVRNANNQGFFFEAIAQSMGENLIQFWAKQVPLGILLFVALIGPNDASEFDSDVHPGSTFIFDIFSILLLFYGRQWGLLKKIPQKKYVPASMLRVINEQIGVVRQQISFGDFDSIGRRGGRLERIRVTSSGLEAHLKELEKLKSDVLRSFIVEEGEIPEDAFKIDHENRTIGTLNADILRAAQIKGYIGVSEDFRFRVLLRDKAAIRGFSLVNIFTSLKSSGRINAKAFERFLIVLVNHNYVNLPLDDALVFACFSFDKYTVGPAMKNVLRVISPSLPRERRVQLVAGFLVKLAEGSRIPRKKKDAAASEILAIYFRAEKSYDSKTVLGNTLERLMPNKEKLAWVEQLLEKAFDEP